MRSKTVWLGAKEHAKDLRFRRILLLAVYLVVCSLVSPGGAWAQSVRALFALETPQSGPFPSDWFTVADASQNTDRRVNLPLPDCNVYVSDCEDLAVINELDGFNLQTRLSIPFDGPIDVSSVTSDSVFLVSLGSTVPGQGYMPRGTVVGINQVVWDVETNTLHVESDALLAQHTRFALVVTNGVRDAGGNPVEASPEFRRLRQTVGEPYKQELLDAIHEARRLGVRERDIVTASVFTTRSATAILEKIRDQIHAATPEPADFLLGPDKRRTVFARADVTGITWNQQLHVKGPLTPVAVDLDPLDIVCGAVGEIAFGEYASPDYTVHPGEFIPPVGTRTGAPVVQGVNEVGFTLFLPSGPRPAGGWPVAIVAHGGSGSRQRDPFLYAATLAAQGIATIGINAVGFGFGPLGTVTINRSADEPVTFRAGGRGFDQNGDGDIVLREGDSSTAPRAILLNTDGHRQTAADLMQLVRVIQVGIDVHGTGDQDLDPSRIYYFGLSYSGFHGTMFLAVEPDVQTGALNVTGGPFIDLIRMRTADRSNVGRMLAGRVPPLLNSPPGVTEIDGLPMNAPYFYDGLPLRDGVSFNVRMEDGTGRDIRSPVTNDVIGAMAIQELVDRMRWVQQAASPPAYAPHLHRSPLLGVPAKSVLYQFPKGDQTIANPWETATIRAGHLADRATFYRHDVAFAEDPTMPRDSHGFVTMVTHTNPNVRDVARGYQAQITAFFASDGKTIIHPEPARFFEVPIAPPLPEELNYIP